MASHIVTLQRRPNTTNLPDDIYLESKRKIGSVFTAGGDVVRGLTLAEQKTLLPEIIGVSPTDVSFTRAAKDYYTNFSLDVPKGGLDLEVGLDEDGTPLNVLDFIKYKFALAHPFVAKTEEEMSGSKRIKYYLQDRGKELVEASQELQIRKKAYREFIKISEDENKMDLVLRVYGERPDKMDVKEKELTLESIQEEDPDRFLEVALDKDLELVSLINECLSKEILRKVGNSILDADVVLGDSMEETILFLKDKKNTGTVTSIKARIKAYS
jgi:hypothetical protein